MRTGPRSGWTAEFPQLVLFFLASAGFSQDLRWISTAGLLQRLIVGIGWLWLTALAVRQMRADHAALATGSVY